MKKQKVLEVLGVSTLIGVSALSLTSCKNPFDTFKDWIHGSDAPEVPKDDAGVTVDGKDVKEGASVPLPKNAIFKRASNQNALSVTATVLPENASQKELSWSLTWKTTSNDNIAEYVTISPSSDTKTCSITVKKGFNIPINLTAKTKDGSSATCQLDFLKQITSFQWFTTGTEVEDSDSPHSIECQANYTFDFTYGNDDIYFSEINDGSSAFGDYLYMWNIYYNNYFENNLHLDYGDCYLMGNYKHNIVGTIGEIRTYETASAYHVLGTDTDVYYNYELTDAAKTALTNANLSKYIKASYTDVSGDSQSQNLMYDMFSSNITSSDIQKILEVLKTCSQNNDIIKCSVEFQSWYGGSKLHTQTITFGMGCTIYTYIPTTSVSLSNSNIIAD